ncbi:MAG: M28 family peptidase [Prevotellaceae bacterium]|jgi:Zn-dependent M28 family amino/carboxypeptidase|nr:M28 family peptidase [Prevotellaceae bacterium]
MKNILIFGCWLLALFVSCASPNPSKGGEQAGVSSSSPSGRLGGAFYADSAYHFVQTQVDFGARVPNTEAHKKCAEFLAATLKRFGAAVTVQKADLTAYDGTILHAQNIIGAFNPDAEERILLMAHWDSRPFADYDPNPENHHKPVLGANDGASGVGVLLEIARIIGQDVNFTTGIDIVFFDAEDYGTPAFANNLKEDTWALGSQYWAQNPHRENYSARFGILLDMVGGTNPVFLQEQYSLQYAPAIVEKVWKAAQEAGFGHLFRPQRGGMITDDHLYVNRLAGIPSIDIIDYDLRRPKGFPNSWHTTYDTMQNIDRETLRAVGQTVLNVIYE